jgi:hypothetical protein
VTWVNRCGHWHCLSLDIFIFFRDLYENARGFVYEWFLAGQGCRIDFLSLGLQGVCRRVWSAWRVRVPLVSVFSPLDNFQRFFFRSTFGCAWFQKRFHIFLLFSTSSYMEMINIDPEVRMQIYKMASISLCSNVEGQIMVCAGFLIFLFVFPIMLLFMYQYMHACM